MLCRDVKHVVYFFLDGSLAETRQRDFQTHLSVCPECEKRIDVHRRLRAFLLNRFSRLNVTAPARLKTRLARSIRAFHAEWSR